MEHKTNSIASNTPLILNSYVLIKFYIHTLFITNMLVLYWCFDDASRIEALIKGRRTVT